MEVNKLIQQHDCIFDKYEIVPHNINIKLNDILTKIEQFYYSEFWTNRFKRRIKEENIDYNPIQLDIIQGSISELKDATEFMLFDKDTTYKGVSNTKNMIALNINIDKIQSNDSHIENIVMHEFGHRQCKIPEFNIINYLNSRILKSPSPMGLENELDYKYFSDKDEIRQRIIPVVKEMIDNKWTLEQTYYLSQNLKQDDLYSLYSKQTLIYWLDNIL